MSVIKWQMVRETKITDLLGVAAITYFIYGVSK